jgi:hypothetical protein
VALDEALLAAVAAVASYLGFALLALSQARHWDEVGAASGRAMGMPWPRSRAAGTALQASALGLSLAAQGPSFGSLLWVMVVCAAAFGVAFTLSWRPSALAPLARLLAR